MWRDFTTIMRYDARFFQFEIILGFNVYLLAPSFYTVNALNLVGHEINDHTKEPISY